MTDEDLVEELADVQHQIWSHWMGYLFSRCNKAADGAVTIPGELVAHWKRQVATSYADLSEREKESDRHQAHKIMAVLGDPLHAVEFPLEDLRIIVNAMLDWTEPPMPEHDATVRVAGLVEKLEAQAMPTH